MTDPSKLADEMWKAFIHYAYPPLDAAGKFTDSDDSLAWSGFQAGYRAALRQSAPGWRAISEADKSQPILAWMWKQWRRAYWDDDRHAKSPRPFWHSYELGISHSREHQPVHFMSMPAPPADGEKNE